MQNLLVKDNPISRSIALCSDRSSKSVLVFEQRDNTTKPECVVQFLHGSEFDEKGYHPLRNYIYGILGLIQVKNDTFIAAVTSCKFVGKIRPEESVYRILDVEFYSLMSSTWDILQPGQILAEEDMLDQSKPVHPCSQLRKLLANRHFYFSPDFDLTRTVQIRTRASSTGKYTFDDRFLWNKFMINGLLSFRARLNRKDQSDLDRSGFLVLAIQGYAGTSETVIGSDRVTLSLISKLGCKRAGTRYNTRGIDDDGNVANFVETETILCGDKWCFAYTQVRGSVPVFWEQQGIQVISHKIQISRGADATQPAVERHFTDLVNRYTDIHIINLLGFKEGEALLGNEYRTHVDSLNQSGIQLVMTNFDFNAMCKNGSYENATLLLRDINNRLKDFGYFIFDIEKNSTVINQVGVFRTNCVDCLDRTNVVQTLLSRATIDLYLRQISCHHYEVLFTYHSHLWAENGDSLSKIYAGTGALKSEFTRSGKFTLAGAFSDAQKTVNRFYINNFQDKLKQDVIDMLLGKLLDQNPITIHDPVHELVVKEIQKRISDYSKKFFINVFVGTYNLNGVLPSEPLSPWLLFFSQDSSPQPEFFVIGFQEIVEISNPKEIVAADPNRLRAWEEEITNTLNNRSKWQTKYVVLRFRQLVGTALFVYARADIVSNVRNVECVTKKTGLGGMAGNKGAVAIRMDYYDTSVCFVTAHLASGSADSDDLNRNSDYKAIDDGLVFRQGRPIHHDNVIWLGDFNYRVSLENEIVRDHAASGNIDALLKADQLINQKSRGAVFSGFSEGPITFLPTYKYDNGTDIYDTSEKQRTPSWTDRILYRGKNLKQTAYTRAELKMSDHRPVMGMFNIEIIEYDEEERARIQQELYNEKLAAAASKTATNSNLDDAPKVDILIEIEDSTLPQPSSDSYQWWNEDGATSNSLIVDKNTIDKGFRAISTNPFNIPIQSLPESKESSSLEDPFAEDNSENLVDVSIPPTQPDTITSRNVINWELLTPTRVNEKPDQDP